MPNLKGMNLKDALFIMERYGIKIIISGSGSIINQSIQSGEHITKETLVKLELA
ncbi:PASTA domain protein [compost metagenome]